MKLYTKGGDKGTTSLAGGERVAKFDKRVEAYGTIDELMAFMALMADKMRSEQRLVELIEDINRINCQLMTIGGLMAAGAGCEREVPASLGQMTLYLEQRIDEFTAELPKSFQFTIPGGSVIASLSHVCRTITRRAERRAIEAAEEHIIAPEALIFINRLSDYLYAMGRIINQRLEVEEILWRC